MSTTGWLKPGVQFELSCAATSAAEYSGGSWSAVKLIQSADGKVLVEMRAAADPAESELNDGATSGGAVVRERAPLSRVRPLPPRTPKEFRPQTGQAVQVAFSGGWWAAIIKAARKKVRCNDQNPFCHVQLSLDVYSDARSGIAGMHRGGERLFRGKSVSFGRRGTLVPKQMILMIEL